MSSDVATTETNLTQAQAERRGLHSAIKELNRLADRIESGGAPPEENKEPVASDVSLAEFLRSLPGSFTDMTKAVQDVRERIQSLLF